jgi:hypothetical protein
VPVDRGDRKTVVLYQVIHVNVDITRTDRSQWTFTVAIVGCEPFEVAQAVVDVLLLAFLPNQLVVP